MKQAGFLRLLCYWGTIVCGVWTMGFFYSYGTEKGREWYRDFSDALMQDMEIRSGTGARLIGVTTPILLASTFAALLVTATPLPRWSLVNKLFSFCRRFPRSQDTKKNQFGLGDMNFNCLACFLVVFPLLAYFLCSVARRLFNPEEDVTSQRKLRTIANTAGIVGVLALSFFLIPVARHSVLLVALGWSPVHALRLHVWAGFASFFFIMMHAIGYVIDWFAFHEESVWEQIIPDRDCWKWKNSDVSRECNNQWYNFSGILAGCFFIVLVVSSLNWFRRKYYNIFYICHVVFGTAMMLMSILHWRPLVTYLLPSIVYYLASTTPTLVQAAMSYFQGGVKLTKVVTLDDGGGCVEAHMATTRVANAILDRESCLFVKVCVPKHSLVWHPFTVFKSTSDSSTLRLLFRPVGPFTKTLASSLLEQTKPRVIVDGFYRGGDRAHEASTQHDQVTVIAGGVAITPFLSMIPQLFSMIESDEQSKTTSVCLHWTVRESGLMSYIQQTYLQDFVATANKLGVIFLVHIHLTGTGRDIESKAVDGDPTEESSSKNGSDLPIISQDKAVSVDSGSSGSTGTGGKTDSEQVQPETLPSGRPVEVARMMPALHNKVVRNVPYFMAFASTLWLCYKIIFAWYQFREYQVNFLYGRVFGVMVALCVALGIGIGIEIVSLRVTTRRDGENRDDHSDDGVAKLHVCKPDEIEVETACTAQIEVHHGRPTADILFSEASRAEAPGIFMCGPVGMTASVRKFAAKENSVFGLTRYCLYEEPFEM